MTVSVRGGNTADALSQNHTTNSMSAPTQQGGQSSGPNQQQNNENSEVQVDCSGMLLPNGEVAFPHAELSRLDEMINRQRWVVPVLPKGELEILLDASIKLCQAGKESFSGSRTVFCKNNEILWILWESIVLVVAGFCSVISEILFWLSKILFPLSKILFLTGQRKIVYAQRKFVTTEQDITSTQQ